MKKRKQPSKEAIERKRIETEERRAHTLEVNETREKGFVATNETLLAKIEQQYQDGAISITEYELAIKMLRPGKKLEDKTEEFGF